MSDRTDRLQERGWEQPLNDSPVQTPPAWSGGSVMNTGGHVYCRIWKRTLPDDSEFEVIYNLDGPSVGLHWYPADDHAPRRLFEIEVREANDQLLANVALMLMLFANFAYEVGGEEQDHD